MSGLDKLRALVAAAPKPPCAALTPFSIVAADAERGLVKVEFESQPAFGNMFGHVQGGFAVAKAIVFAEGRLWGSDGRLAVHATATLAAK
jgi:hypothetical protein